MTYKLRKPDKKELGDLRQYLLGLEQDTETTEIIINTHFFGVMFAVYGMPEFYEAFIWIDNKIAKVELDEGFELGVRKRYLKNLTDEELTDEFDRTLDIFKDRYNINSDKLEKLLIGWIDYKYSKMGKLETEIKNTIKELIK